MNLKNCRILPRIFALMFVWIGTASLSALPVVKEYEGKPAASLRHPGVTPSQNLNPIPIPVDGSMVQSSITRMERVVLFVFSPPVDGLYVIETFPGFFGDAIDTFIALFGPDDPSIFISNDDDAGFGLLSQIVVELEGGRVYFVSVESFDGVETGPFQIEVRSQSDIDVLDPALSVSLFVEDLMFEPAAITVDPIGEMLYVTASNTDGDLWKINRDGEVELVRAFFSDVSRNALFYPFLSTDIQYHNGFVFTVLSDGQDGEVVGIDVESGEAFLFYPQSGLGFEAGMAAQDNQLIVSDGQGTADSVWQVDLINNAATVVANGAVGGEMVAIEIAPNTRSVFGYDFINGFLGVQADSVIPLANGVLQANTGFFAVDPNGAFFYNFELGGSDESGSLNRIAVASGEVERLIQNLPFPNGDLTFGPSSSGEGQSLYFPAQNNIYEISGFSFQVNPQPPLPPIPVPQMEPTPTPTVPSVVEIGVNENIVDSALQTAEGVWFSFQTSIRGVYLIETSTRGQSNVDPIMELYGPNNQTDLIEVNDDLDPFTLNPRISSFLPGNMTFFVRVFPFSDINAGFPPVLGPFSLLVLGPDVSDTAGPQREVLARYEFGEETLSDAEWNELPGGFGGFQPGGVSIIDFPADRFPNSGDHRGLQLQVSNLEGNNPQLVFLHAIASVLPAGKPVVIKMRARSDSPNASLFLAALKGNLLTSEAVDGSLALNQVNTTASLLDQPQDILMVYKPDSDSPVNPIIQAVSSGDGSPVSIWIDWLEVFGYEDEGLF